MPQFPVVGYALQVSTNPQQVPGAPAVPFRAAVAIQFQPQGPFQPLVINGPDEFMAIAALLQTPGRLMFDPVGATLEKIEP
jgi:hypothetical protein